MRAFIFACAVTCINFTTAFIESDIVASSNGLMNRKRKKKISKEVFFFVSLFHARFKLGRFVRLGGTLWSSQLSTNIVSGTTNIVIPSYRQDRNASQVILQLVHPTCLHQPVPSNDPLLHSSATKRAYLMLHTTVLDVVHIPCGEDVNNKGEKEKKRKSQLVFLTNVCYSLLERSLDVKAESTPLHRIPNTIRNIQLTDLSGENELNKIKPSEMKPIKTHDDSLSTKTGREGSNFTRD